MTVEKIKWPPEGKEVYVSLRDSNGEHIVYSCIYMGMGIFKFLPNGEQYACEVQKETKTAISIEKGIPETKEMVEDYTIYLIGKPVINWWVKKS